MACKLLEHQISECKNITPVKASLYYVCIWISNKANWLPCIDSTEDPASKVWHQ